LIEIPNLDIGGGDSRNPIGGVKSREEAIDLLKKILINDGDHATYNTNDKVLYIRQNR
jgi:hypothetical protein